MRAHDIRAMSVRGRARGPGLATGLRRPGCGGRTAQPGRGGPAPRCVGIALERPDCRRREHPGARGPDADHGADGPVTWPVRPGRHRRLPTSRPRVGFRGPEVRWYIA